MAAEFYTLQAQPPFQKSIYPTQFAVLSPSADRANPESLINHKQWGGGVWGGENNLSRMTA